MSGAEVSGRAVVQSLLLLAAVGLVSASGGTQEPPPERLIREPAARRPAPRRSPAQRTVRSLPYPPCPAPRGAIHRHQLKRILARGPGLLLSGVEVRMVPWRALPPAARQAWTSDRRTARSSHFGGWRILRFHPEDPCLGRAGLIRGDVLFSINGRALRRPSDLHTLWTQLANVRRLVIRLIRRGEPLVFVVRVLPARSSRRDGIDGDQAR